MRDWPGTEVEVATSAGWVIALADPWQNLIRTSVLPWPPPELIQNLYQSQQIRAFSGLNRDVATRVLGFYSDLQSVHSEDAITWSVFGPIVYGTPAIKIAFVEALFGLIGVQSRAPISIANLWLWHRLPHPDALVPGGPEVDVGVQTDEIFLVGEAKWLSSVGAAQGVNHDKDQITLRREFCTKYGRRLLPGCRRFVVLGISLAGGLVSPADAEVEGISLHARDTTWSKLAALDVHPLAAEVRAYLSWKQTHSRTK